jgi:uncharacterized protein YkwD
MRRALRRVVLLIGGCLATWASAADAPKGKVRPPVATKTVAAKALNYDEAQRFVLALVNRDRKKAGLSPVELDEPASKSGLRHVRDMVANGFTGHVGSDGSVPEQRYTEAGGSQFVQENAACLFDLRPRQVEENARFDAEKLAALHEMFMAEVPPNDGHRRNILKPLHNRVGIAVAKPAGVAQPCLTQEFVDQYGEYEPLPAKAKANTKLRVAGVIAKALRFGGVGVGRTPPSKPTPRERLNGSLYRIPAPDTMYFPAGFKTPKPVNLEGQRFNIELELAKSGEPGTYSVSVWAKEPGSSQLFMISMRTISVQ